MPESCSFFNNTLLLPNDVLLVHSNFARVIKSVLHLHMLLRLAGAACNVRCNRQLARAAHQPSAEHSAKRHNRVAVDVVAVLRVQIKRPVTHALANGPHVVEAGDVHAIGRDDLQSTSGLQHQRAVMRAGNASQAQPCHNTRHMEALAYHAEVGGGHGAVLSLVAHLPRSHAPVGC